MSRTILPNKSLHLRLSLSGAGMAFAAVMAKLADALDGSALAPFPGMIARQPRISVPVLAACFEEQGLVAVVAEACGVEPQAIGDELHAELRRIHGENKRQAGFE